MLMIRANFSLQKVMADTHKKKCTDHCENIKAILYSSLGSESKTVMNLYLGAMKVEYTYYKSLD